MLNRTRETQMDKATNMMRDVLKYAQGVAQDERLRADFRAAVDHGSQASERLKKDIQGGSIYTRLAADKKLRKHLRAMLDDLDDAGSRMRRGRSHRVRNASLVLAGAVAAALAFPRVRPWLEERASDIFGTGSAEPDPLT
jgi:signal transduction protein with GAF and PtsI domain